MKKKLLFLIVALLTIATGAKADVAINENIFPDAIFCQWVKDNCDTDHNGMLDIHEIAMAQRINIPDMGIANLKSIEHFTNLSVLLCYKNQLTSLDVSKNLGLWMLNCSNNRLTSLDVTHNVGLTALTCNNNQLTSLDVTKNTDLSNLYCHKNGLTSLDVSKNTALQDLWCFDNKLTSLDVTKNTELLFFLLPK